MDWCELVSCKTNPKPTANPRYLEVLNRTDINDLTINPQRVHSKLYNDFQRIHNKSKFPSHVFTFPFSSTKIKRVQLKAENFAKSDAPGYISSSKQAIYKITQKRIILHRTVFIAEITGTNQMVFARFSPMHTNIQPTL